jgi:hypothetical protein
MMNMHPGMLVSLEARQKWADYIGYLADDQVLVLYSRPQVYRIIPQGR